MVDLGLDLDQYWKIDNEALNLRKTTWLSEAYPLSDLVRPYSEWLGDMIFNTATRDGYRNHPERVFSEYHYPLLASMLLYLPVVFGIKYIMKDKKPFDLQYPLILWNFIMALFSTFCFLYVLPMAFNNFKELGWSMSVCGRWCLSYGEEAFLVFLFNLSKAFEFVDTIFIVLRKKPLIFLHYYHHVVTMSFCWYMNQSAANFGCYGFHFATLNLLVHSIMYSYYGIMAMKICRFPTWVATAITAMQIVQMIIGVAVVTTTAFCPRVDQTAVIFGGCLYASFFALFAQFFYNRYIAKKEAAKARSEAAAAKSRDGKKKKSQ
eukprot:CAMPEP_0119130884 /NCGR_PEP_ID=MMETSP1310-20130426/9018_1 /TAXON_ID=464262 /ORGANISM="Genus nov. species nov., Strain RCC2339" /LENGTH=319 /DNA_ID=CAMNT_0007121423 /DNA_START=180 /DNA_END=1139 /DNA_ORIENTATION=+